MNSNATAAESYAGPSVDDDLTLSVTHLIVEPFFGGSHAQLGKRTTRSLIYTVYYGAVWIADSNSAATVRALQAHLPYRFDVYTLPARKFHWRLRASALHFAETIARRPSYRQV